MYEGNRVPELVIATAAGLVLLRIDLSARTKLTIGRSERCDVRLKGAAVSRHHALLINECGRWRILDLSAKSGVWVGEHRERVTEMQVDVPVRIGDAYVWLFDAEHVESATPLPLPATDQRRVMLRQEYLECLWRHSRTREPEVDEQNPSVASPHRRMIA